MRSVEFINYTGEHKEIDSVSAIKEIGTDLGKSVVAEKPSSHGSRDKYAIVHAVDADEKEKLDADIFFIGKDATVARYKTAVMKNLSKKNCGLSTSYKDWPEKTEMVIPLSVNGKSVKVDASALRDEKVANYMKEGDKKKKRYKGLAFGAYSKAAFATGDWADYVSAEIGGGVGLECTLPLDFSALDVGFSLRGECLAFLPKSDAIVNSGLDISVLPGVFVRLRFVRSCFVPVARCWTMCGMREKSLQSRKT